MNVLSLVQPFVVVIGMDNPKHLFTLEKMNNVAVLSYEIRALLPIIISTIIIKLNISKQIPTLHIHH